MMHWSYRIYRKGFNPAHVPLMPAVNIESVHETLEQSVAAAATMVMGFQMINLSVAPALDSLHCVREAIDMRIWWAGDLTICRSDGTVNSINTLPRTGMNLQLKEVGRSYEVIKFVGGNSDKPHCSATGN